MKSLGAAGIAASVGVRASATGDQGAAAALDGASLVAIAEIVLPSEIGVAGRERAVAAFVRWLRNYRAGADMDHGYGNTRIRATGPSPEGNYSSQLAALDAAAREKGLASFAEAGPDVRRALIERAIADARIERLPGRPTGAFIATDLMGHYFNSSAAADLCYRAAIGRDACRGLPGSEQKPAAFPRP